MEAAAAPPDHVNMGTLWQQTDKLRSELLGAIGAVRSELHSYIEKHDAEHDSARELEQTRRDAHNLKHEAERKERASLIRWAVTTVVGVAGVGIAIVLPLTQR